MINRKTLGIAGAAILGTVVGTSPAYAVITLENGVTKDAPTFARETLTTVKTADDTDYYVVTGGSSLSTRVPLDVVKAANEVLSITIEAENMIFLATPPSFGATGGEALDLLGAGPTYTAINAAETDFNITAAVRDGDTSVTFTLGGATEVEASDLGSRYLEFTINNMGVRDGVDGSFRVTVRNQTNGVSKITTVANAVKTARALRLSNVEEDLGRPQPLLIAGVEYDFKRFTGPAGGTPTPGGITVARLGGYAVSLTSGILDAGGAVATLGDVMATARSRIGGMGAVSFADDVYLDSNSSCNSTSGTVSLLTDGAWKEGRARPAISDNLSMNLCIKVDGDTEVPETEPYQLVLDFDPAAGAAFPPTDQTLTLGSIVHDAAEASIPYVTTFGNYNQRLILTNSWSKAASYTVTFTTEDDVTATVADAATGEIAAGTVMVLPMADLVTIEGGTRAAARVVVEAPDGSIGVATTQVNRSTGTTDTVVYDVD